MRHRKNSIKLGRSLGERKALLQKLARSLFLHERITTTKAKAKALRPYAERRITAAKTGTIAARRKLAKDFGATTVKRLVEDIAPRYSRRAGGYTRIMALPPRKGDGAEMAIIELVETATA